MVKSGCTAEDAEAAVKTQRMDVGKVPLKTLQAAWDQLSTELRSPVLKGDSEFAKELRNRCESLVSEADDGIFILKTVWE